VPAGRKLVTLYPLPFAGRIFGAKAKHASFWRIPVKV
jgi:hypothetical protein